MATTTVYIPVTVETETKITQTRALAIASTISSMINDGKTGNQ